ncbi:two component transcriptional regulator, winged helix family (plasmid) [Emticicia oligotrophica DSM 17448]|uniref:Two component transcriptional regulator, winged helix family n=1 Tax=Emticicia oligotrophica (strain DSM 17448 / CIP 109782 / MTCC 6937 / GPTSA100-15) TaxID=929562 RepID=A0ABM5N805_EMTOG|nr:response regulator transcription factor [Emticicia oligotrophica]AFK05563.1 two component transcriptional regulator, winged helix family [Emticicia oligotrophica DSM 17448]
MKILLIEDEKALALDIINYLNSQDTVCEWVDTFKDANEKIQSYDYDCILLDLSLPDGNGMQLLEQLKNAKKLEGIIIISAKDTLEVRIEGLNLGADDFLMKPFHLAELMARIQAVIRRKKFEGNNTVVFNEIQIDILSKTIHANSRLVEATKKEFDLLVYLIGNKNRVLSKAVLAEYISGDMADMLDNHDFVYAHIKNLKKKLSAAGVKDYLKTVYGLGYKWQD